MLKKTVLLLSIFTSLATDGAFGAVTCIDLLSSIKSLSQISSEKLLQIDSSILADSEYLIPTNVDVLKSFTLEDLETNSALINDNAIPQGIVELLTSDDVLLISHTGYSIWPFSVFSSWLQLGESDLLTDPVSAQRAIHSFVRGEIATISGIPEFWLNELKASSERLKAARSESDSNLGFSFDPLAPYSIDSSSWLRSSRGKRVQLAHQQNRIDFPWGQTLDFMGYNEMDQYSALFVLRTLSLIPLFSNTVVEVDGIYKNTSRDNLIGLDTVLFLASNPTMLPLIKYLISNPVDAQGSIVHSHVVGDSQDGDFDLFSTSRELNSGDVLFTLNVFADSVDLRFTFDEEISPSLFRQDVQLIEALIKQSVSDTRKWQGKVELPIDRFELVSDGIYYNTNFHSLSGVEAILAALRFRELIELNY